mmetsp:Transcript_14523/g.31293  ORF Transcript_14523/g.31293 Transcript_14523/m.31293 type:complete len:248 (+) Transcript_14523:3-746(+)
MDFVMEASTTRKSAAGMEATALRSMPSILIASQCGGFSISFFPMTVPRQIYSALVFPWMVTPSSLGPHGMMTMAGTAARPTSLPAILTARRGGSRPSSFRMMVLHTTGSALVLPYMVTALSLGPVGMTTMVKTAARPTSFPVIVPAVRHGGSRPSFFRTMVLQTTNSVVVLPFIMTPLLLGPIMTTTMATAAARPTSLPATVRMVRDGSKRPSFFPMMVLQATSSALVLPFMVTPLWLEPKTMTTMA